LVIVLAYAYYTKKSSSSYFVEDKDSSLLTHLPQVEFQKLSQEVVSINTLKSNESWTLIHYWATWCGPCDAELPELIRFFQSFKSSKAKLILVAVNDEVPKVEKFIKALNIKDGSKIEWVLDSKSVHIDKFGTSKLPESFVFSSDGKLYKKFIGPQEWEKPHFYELFQNFSQN
jgi:thiol-disulfide isomerase/thioredoxin